MTARLRHFLSFGFAVLLLSACSSQPSSHLGELPKTPQATAQQLLQQALSSEPEQASLLRLSAADLSLRQGNLAQAKQALGLVPLDSLKPAQQIFAKTLLIELALAEKQPEQALAAAQHPSFQWLSELPLEQQIRSHLARAQAFEINRQEMAALRERVYLARLLSRTKQSQDNHEAIWALVSALPRQSLQPTGDADLDGWLSLAATIQQAGTLNLQKQAIVTWQQQHPMHPAAKQLPQPLLKLQQMADRPIERVALLLPNQGQLVNVAQALRKGFLAAHLQAQQGGQAIPYIKFYDSTKIASLDDFYQQAASDGIQLVIGPLEKDLVRQLSSRPQLPITTLALNYSDNTTQKTPPQLFQFGLAAEDEAREVARRAWADGYRRAIALAPEGDWGARVLNAFRQSWQNTGGTLIAAESLAQPVALSSQIAKLLKLRQSGQILNGTTGQPTEVGPNSDFLFLTATPQQAQQIKPTLTYENTDSIAVYATSHVNAANNSQYQDLNGIRFTETPWLLNPQLPLRQQTERQWPQAGGALGRLYAMGADAYLLAPRLSQLTALPSTQLEGLSGTLSLSEQQRITRVLPWAEFNNGSVVPSTSSSLP